MINKQFEAYKLEREIKRSGITFEIKRDQKDEFGEPIDPPVLLGSFKGLYHEETNRIAITTGETTQYRNKKQPKILCLYDMVHILSLKPNDYLLYQGNKYAISGVENIQSWNIICDISLEVFDNGTKAEL